MQVKIDKIFEFVRDNQNMNNNVTNNNFVFYNSKTVFIMNTSFIMKLLNQYYEVFFTYYPPWKNI